MESLDRRTLPRKAAPKDARISRTIRLPLDLAAKLDSFAWGEANVSIEKALRRAWKMPAPDTAK